MPSRNLHQRHKAALSTKCRALQPLTAWVATEAAQVGRCPAGDMVLLFSALETAVKRIAFTVRQASPASGT